MSFISEVQTIYGFHVNKFEQHPKGEFLETDRGLCLLREVHPGDSRKLPFVLAVSDYLKKQGFVHFFNLIPNKNGKYFAMIGGKKYYVTEWGADQGTYFDYYDFGVRLAQLHQKSRGFKFSSFMGPMASFGSWLNTWKKKISTLESYRDSLENKENLTNFDYFYLEQFTYLMQMGDTAVQYLINTPYKKLSQSLKEKGKLAFMNISFNDLYVDPYGSVIFCDPFSWVMDIRIRDLAQFIKSDVRINGWDQGTIYQMLSGYQKVNPLEPEEFSIVYANLLFPGRFIKKAEMILKGSIDFNVENINELHKELILYEELCKTFPSFVENHFNVVIPRVDWIG